MLDKLLLSEDVLCIFPGLVLLAMFGIGIVHIVWTEVFKIWEGRGK